MLVLGRNSIENFNGFTKIQQQVLFFLQKTIFFLESTQSSWIDATSLVFFQFLEKENSKISTSDHKIKNFVPFFLFFAASFTLNLFTKLKGTHASIPMTITTSELQLIKNMRKKIIKKFKKLQKNEKEIFEKIICQKPEKDEKIFEETWFNLMKQLQINKKSSIFPKLNFETESFFESLCETNRFKEELLKVSKILGKGGEYELKTETISKKAQKSKPKTVENEENDDFGNDRFGALRKLISPTTFNFLM